MNYTCTVDREFDERVKDLQNQIYDLKNSMLTGIQVIIPQKQSEINCAVKQAVYEKLCVLRGRMMNPPYDALKMKSDFDFIIDRIKQKEFEI